MDAGVISAIVIALGSAAVALITAGQNRSGAKATNSLTQRVVDREDFEAVMSRMGDSLNRSDIRITELERRLEAEVESREEADGRARAAEERARAAEIRADRLEKRVSQLEQVLKDHDIEVPPIT